MIEPRLDNMRGRVWKDRLDGVYIVSHFDTMSIGSVRYGMMNWSIDNVNITLRPSHLTDAVAAISPARTRQRSTPELGMIMKRCLVRVVYRSRKYNTAPDNGRTWTGRGRDRYQIAGP
jgi:hypothetical protein